MYNSLFYRFGIDAVYLAFDVDPMNAHKVSEIIQTMGLEGVNLTVPFKDTLFNHMDSLSKTAVQARAINVVTQSDNTLAGHNTDGDGFVQSLSEEGGPEIEGLQAIILGAGGAARSIASSLLSRGAQRIHFLNRTKARAQTTVEILSQSFPNAELLVQPLDGAAFSRCAKNSRLVVNCTSGSANTIIDSFDPMGLAPQASWFDINYWMAHPPGKHACDAIGVQFHDGLGMLAHQGALAFELFTGCSVTGAELKAFLLEQA